MNRCKSYRPFSRRALALTTVTALLSSCATLVAVLGLFESAGSTPWYSAEYADAVGHCQPASVPAQRHECLQASAAQPATVRVAAR